MPTCPTNFEPEYSVAALVRRIEALAAELAELQAMLSNTPRLHVKDVLSRYGWSPSTLYRRLRAGRFPAPVRLAGSVWRLDDLERAERAGQVPRTHSGQPMAQSRTRFCPVSA